MKRKFAVTLAGALALGMGIQTAAAPSINGGTVDQGQVMIDTEANGSDAAGDSGVERGWSVKLTEFDKEDYPEEIQNLIDRVTEVQPEETVADVYREFIDLSGLKVFDIESVHLEEEDGEALLEKMHFLSDIEQIVFDGVEPTEEKPLGVTFVVNNMTETMDVYVMDRCEKDGWELLETDRMSDNQIKAKFHAKASLVAFVYLENDEQVREKIRKNISIEEALAAVLGQGDKEETEAENETETETES